MFYSNHAVDHLSRRLGLGLRILRREARLTQSGLACAAGLDDSRLASIEQGEVRPTASELFILLERLGREPLDLFQVLGVDFSNDVLNPQRALHAQCLHLLDVIAANSNLPRALAALEAIADDQSSPASS